MTRVSDFADMSSYLTGFGVDAALASEYLDRIRAEPFGAAVDRLVASFVELKASSSDLATDVRRSIVESAELGDVAQQVILLWYTSAFDVAGNWKFGTPEHYFRALLWPAIGAHPPALSGGYFGYWKYPPEN